MLTHRRHSPSPQVCSLLVEGNLGTAGRALRSQCPLCEVFWPIGSSLEPSIVGLRIASACRSSTLSEHLLAAERIADLEQKKRTHPHFTRLRSVGLFLRSQSSSPI